MGDLPHLTRDATPARRQSQCNPPRARYYTGGPDVDHAYYRCPHDPANPAHLAQAPATPAALTAIITAAGITDLAAYLNGHAPAGDLSRHPGRAKRP
jgi:hypothetical protein